MPIRQWTLAFPRRLKLVLAMDASLLSAALRAFVGAIFALQRRRAKQLGIEGARPGAVAFLQYFTSALLLHPHAHVLVPDGVFQPEGDFAALPPPDDEAVELLLRKVARRVWKLARARPHSSPCHWADARGPLHRDDVLQRLLASPEVRARSASVMLFSHFSLRVLRLLPALHRTGSYPPQPKARLNVLPVPVKKAWRVLIIQYHPDKVAHLAPEFRSLAEVRTREIMEAWDRLQEELR